MANLPAKKVETAENHLNQAQNMMQVMRLCQVILYFFQYGFYLSFVQFQLMFKIQISLTFKEMHFMPEIWTKLGIMFLNVAKTSLSTVPFLQNL